MRNLWFFLLFMLLALPVQAEEATVEGTVETRVFTAGDARVETVLDTVIKIPLSDEWQLRLRPYVQLLVARWGQAIGEFGESQANQARVVEAFFTWAKGPWEIGFGQQYVDLGRIDILSPLDLWRARDVRDLLEDQPVGTPTLSVSYTPKAGTSYQLFYSPAQTASLLPGPGSDWWFGPRVPVELGSPSGGAFGLVTQQTFGELDVTVLALRHNDPYPIYLPSGLGLPSSPAGIREQYLEETVVGVGARFPVFQHWNATVETALHLPDEGKARYLATVVQLERIWQLSSKETLTVDLGYADRTGGSDPTLDLGSPFRQAPFVNVQYSVEDGQGLDTTMELRAIGSGLSGYYLQPQVSRQINPDVRVSIGGSILLGKPDTFFGAFQGNSRFELKGEVKF